MEYFKNKKQALLILFIFSAWIVTNILYITWLLVQNPYFLPDDVYYYILTALNYVKYGFYTFDTINATNGFHPFTMWLETILIYIVGEDSNRYTIYYSVIGFIGSSIAFFSIFQAWYLFKKQSQYLYPFVITLSILLSIFGRYYFNGLESFLVLIFTSSLVLLLLNKKLFLASIVGSLLVMSRLDSVIYLLPPLYLSACFTTFKKHQYLECFKKLTLLFLPSIIFLILYMLYNYSVFGHFKPITAELKSTFPFPNPQFGFLTSKQTIITLFIIVLTIIVLFVNKNIRLHQKSIVLGLIGATFMYILNFMLFQNWLDYIPSWYWSTPFLIIFIAFFLSSVNLFNSTKTRLFTIIILSSTIIIHTFRHIYQYKLGYFSVDNMGKATHIPFLRNLLNNNIIAYTDNGLSSFFSEKNIINLDGLINNFEYQSFLKNKQLKQYLKIKNVNYLIANFHKKTFIQKIRFYGNNKTNVLNGDYSSTPYFLYSYMYKQFSDTLYLHKSAEIFRQTGKDNNSVLIIYDLNKNAEYQDD